MSGLSQSGITDIEVRHDKWSGADLITAVALAILGGVVAVATAAYLFSPANLDNDAAQHLSVASNLLAGNGLSTSLLFYDEHYLQGQLPAEQTIWPPGMPLILAGLMWLGVEDITAVLAVGVVSHAVSAALLFLAGRAVGLRNLTAIAVTVAWLSFPTTLGLVIRGYTEPLFTVFILLAFVILVRAWARPEQGFYRNLLLAGSALAASLCLRYAGVALIAGLAAVVLLYEVKRRSDVAAIVKAVGAVTVVPGSLAIVLLIRNLNVTDTPTGWPNSGMGGDALTVARHAYWTITELIGSTGSFRWIAFALAGIALWLVAMATSWWKTPDGRAWVRRAMWPAIVYVAWVGVTFVMLAVLALRHSPEFMNWRYFAPLIPVMLIIVGAIVESALQASPARTGLRLRASVLTAALVSLWVLGQVRASDLILTNGWLAERAQIFSSTVETTVAGRALGSLLIDDAAPILSNEGQGLGMLLGHPTLTLAPLTFANHPWHDPDVKRLVDQYCVQWLVFFPSLFGEVDDPINANRGFFKSLARGSHPPWVTAFFESPESIVYKLRSACDLPSVPSRPPSP